MTGLRVNILDIIGSPTFQDCSRIPVGDILKVWHGKPLFRKGSNHNFDLDLWKPFIKYLNMLYWTDDETDTGTLSFLEMVVDFELYSGFRVQDPRAGIYTTWARKAAITSTLWQCALKYSIGELSKSDIKAVRFQALLPFGVGGKVMGLNKRPMFLMAKKTEELIAHNALALAGLDKRADKSI